jgi:hypothetical protein
MLDPVIFEQVPDLDGAGRGETAVGVDEQCRAIAESPADRRHDLLGAARPFVDVMAVFGSDAELEGVEAELALQALHPLGLGGRRDVAPHRRGIGAQWSRRPAEQADDRQAGLLAAAIPDRGIEAAERALHIGAGKLVFALDNLVGQRVDVVELDVEHPGGDLAMQHGRGDIGIVGRDLADARCAVIGGDAHEANELRRKRLYAFDSHSEPSASRQLHHLPRLYHPLATVV